jgi:ribonuclease P protein component
VASNYRFLPTHHLRTQREFQHAYGDGVKVYSKLFTLFLCENTLSHSRIGFSVRKKFGPAPQRNLFKRRMREIFRQHHAHIFPPVDIIVIPGREATSASYHHLEKGFCYLVGIPLLK